MSSFRYNPSATLISLRPMSSKMCNPCPRTTVTHLSGLYRYMMGYPGLVAAIGQVRFPTIEVHVSNPASRGAVSEIATACRGVVTGFGIFGYYLALMGALNLVTETTSP